MISKNFARCLAKISGDGNLYYRYIRYSNKCQILLEEFENDIIKEFGPIKITKGISNSGTPFYQIHGKRIINEFLNHLDDFKSSSLLIPNSIKQSNLSVQSQYLRALYDDEGSVCFRYKKDTKEWKRVITLTSNSIALLNDVKDMLQNFNIASNNIYRNGKRAYDKSSVLSISGKSNFKKFNEKIGFKIPYKSQLLALMIESYGNTPSRNKSGFIKIKEKLSLIKKGNISP